MKVRWDALKSLVPAGLVFVVGLVWTGISVRTFFETRANRAARMEVLASLHELAVVAEEDLASLRAFDALSSHQPAALQPLIQSVLSDVKADIRRRDRTAAVGGWAAQQVEVRLERVQAADLGALLDRLEAGRPPWRLVDIQLLALPSRPEQVGVTLLLEGVGK